MIIKASVVIMGILIIAGLVFVGVKLSEKIQSGKAKITPPVITQSADRPVELALTEGEQIERVFSCAPNICVFTTDSARLSKLWIISPESGTLIQTILFPKN